jgi:hypothetical protein
MDSKSKWNTIQDHFLRNDATLLFWAWKTSEWFDFLLEFWKNELNPVQNIKYERVVHVQFGKKKLSI